MPPPLTQPVLALNMQVNHAQLGTRYMVILSVQSVEGMHSSALVLSPADARSLGQALIKNAEGAEKAILRPVPNA